MKVVGTNLSRAVHEKYSEAGRQPNVFYVRRAEKYYDFSGVSGLDVADDSRAFAVTDLDGDGNLDLILKSRLGPQVRLFQNACGQARKSVAFYLRGVKSNRDAIGARIEADGKVKFVTAGSGYLSQHSKAVHFGLGERETVQVVRISWPSGRTQEFQALAAGYRYEIEEGSQHAKATAFKLRIELPAGAPTGDNETHFADTWLLKPVPLPEQTAGPAFLRLSNLTGERASWYSIFCRYLFDLRADVKLPVWFLVDDRSRAHKIYFSPPDPADLQRLKDRDRLSLALPAPGRYYTEPERNYTALGAAFAAAGHPEQAPPLSRRSAPGQQPRTLRHRQDSPPGTALGQRPQVLRERTRPFPRFRRRLEQPGRCGSKRKQSARCRETLPSARSKHAATTPLPSKIWPRSTPARANRTTQ